jgi:predicted nucleic acid-binding protein
VTERVLCLDTSVLIKYLAPDEQDATASSLILDAIQEGARLVLPAWAWAEVGSVLRKKIRAGVLQPTEARDLWAFFLQLPLEYVDTPALRTGAWQLAERYGLPTLYDAAFLACAEVVPAAVEAAREFWTADGVLLRSLGMPRPGYVRELGIDT